MNYQKEFPGVFEVVRSEYLECSSVVGPGHDFLHACRVAHWAAECAASSRSRSQEWQLAWLAGLCHDADHLMINPHCRSMTPRTVGDLVRRWLSSAPRSVNANERAAIVRAVTSHHLPNEQDDSYVAIALKDADRLVSMGLDVAIRLGQLRSYLPVVDKYYPELNPEASFANPCCILRDLENRRAWADPKNIEFCVRTRRAQEEATRRAQCLQQFIDGVLSNMEADGISLPLGG